MTLLVAGARLMDDRVTTTIGVSTIGVTTIGATTIGVTGAVTVNVLLPEMDPSVAVSVVVPGDIPVTKPVAVSTDAMALDDEVQDTKFVITIRAPSVK